MILSDRVMQSSMSVGGEYQWDDTNFAIIMETEDRRMGVGEGKVVHCGTQVAREVS